MQTESDLSFVHGPRLLRPVRILVVVAPFYRAITDALLIGVQSICADRTVDVSVCNVSGALEIPIAVQIARTRLPIAQRYDGFIALGCVVRGETTHYDTVCTQSAQALMTIGLQGVPIGNGILTVETIDQARARAMVAPKGGVFNNHGATAARGCLSLLAWAQQADESSA